MEDQNAGKAIKWICITIIILGILFGGEPDIADGITQHLQNCN